MSVPAEARPSSRPLKRILVLLNPSAGTLASATSGGEAERIGQRLAQAGVEADVRVLDAEPLLEAARSAAAAAFDAVIGGGGDGTLNALANVLSAGDVAFGVLPLGTHNHFAKDLGLPLDLDAAVDALIAGQVVDLPVAQVNGTIFLNFSAVGFHPELIRHREAQRRARGRGKWAAMFIAFWRQIWRFPVLRVTLSSGGDALVRTTPSVIVCNNPHQMAVFGVQNASIPQRGLLHVYVARGMGRAGFLWMLARALWGRLEPARDFEVLVLPELSVRVWGRGRGRMRVSVDGEVADIASPLRYKVHPRPLRVICPPGSRWLTESV